MYSHGISRSFVLRYVENHEELDSVACVAARYGLDSSEIEFW